MILRVFNDPKIHSTVVVGAVDIDLRPPMIPVQVEDLTFENVLLANGSRVNLIIEEEVSVQALEDAIGFKQRLLFVNNALRETNVVAEQTIVREERFHWSQFVLTNLSLTG